MLDTSLRRARLLTAIFTVLLLLPFPLRANQPRSLEDLRRQARAFEQQHKWLEACRCHEEILRRDRGQVDSRKAYQRCLRRWRLVSRHADPGYGPALARLTPSQALDLYEQVLSPVSSAYVDRRRVSLNQLFQHGVEELRFALDEKSFRAEYLPGARAQAVAALQARLRTWRGRRIASRADARDQVLAVVRAARQEGLDPRPSLLAAFALEFAAGACAALDEHTLFLAPGRYSEVQATLRGKLVAVGLDLGVFDDKLAITRVYPRSPAREAGLMRHDRLLRVDRVSVEDLTPEVVAGRLRGEPGSVVELEVLSAGQMMTRVVKLVRRAVVVPSVEYTMLNPGSMSEPVRQIGWMRISLFQESTPQEVKEALAALQREDMKALILDLRGNPGGLFKSAVQVAELFLSEGVIVQTQSQFKEYNRAYKVEGMSPFLLPLVVLVDGETASGAEVVAGALKDHARARLVGQTTYGKGSIQCVIPLDRPPLQKAPSGIRITVAHFYSPTNQPYNGLGVTPHDICDVDNAALRIAAAHLASLLGRMPPMPMMTGP